MTADEEKRYVMPDKSKVLDAVIDSNANSRMLSLLSTV